MVALGGAAGTLARHGLAVWIDSIWTIAAINIVGSFTLGLLIAGGDGVPEQMRVGVGAGLLGGFTTFSTFSAHTIVEADSGAIGMAALYVAVTVIGSLVAASAGYLLARKFA